MNFFNENPRVAVITTKRILNKEAVVLLIFHDDDDGMWQFLDGELVKEDDASVISLEEMISIDDSVNKVSSLPLGWLAYRETQDSEWIKQPRSN